MPKGDGGHWPKGRRRNKAQPKLVAKLRKMLKKESLRGVARAVGVDVKSIKRWLSYECYPAAEHAAAIRRLKQ